jgi:hypothetical protein
VTDVLRPLVLFLVVVGTAACGATTPPVTSPPSATLATTAPAATPTLDVSPSDEPTPSASVPVEPSTAPPTETSSPNVTPSPTPGGPGASACSGSSQTKDFFTAIAEAVQWPVFCAALPAGWSVDRGSGNTYALANGGRMVIGYHTLAGLHLELREGHWCTESVSACSPHDQVIGPLALGELDGQLMTNGSDGYVVYVDPGQVPSWTVTGTGMDEAAFRDLVAALAVVQV